MSQIQHETTKLSDVLADVIDCDTAKLYHCLEMYKMNMIWAKNTYKTAKRNPLPGANYVKLTMKLHKERKQILRNIRYLSASIISAKAQLREIES